jgi:MarR family transcriptional regulator, lower aerobic nicotinate degradation pathway regulator
MPRPSEPTDESNSAYCPARRLSALPTWLINQAARRAYRLSNSALEASGSHTRDYALLANLVEFGSASQAELARRSGIDTSDVVASLDAMEARREVVRRADPADRRRNVVAATPDGRRRLAQLDRTVQSAQEEFLEKLTAAERQTLVRLLERVGDLQRRG